MAIRKFRKRMKPFILIITVVFLLSLAFGGYESYRNSRANKKAQEAFCLNGKCINKIVVEREKNKISEIYQRNTNLQLDKDLIDILAFNQVIEKELVLQLAKKLKIKISSSEVDNEYKAIEATIGDKAQFKRMLEFQGLTKATYKEKIEEELLAKKTIESFINQVKPTEKEIENFYYFNIQDKTQSLDSLKEKIIKMIQAREGSRKYIETLGKLKKEAKIKELAKEYENLVEKVVYEEDGFKVTNLDLAKEETLSLIGKTEKITKEQIEKKARETISQGIKLAKKAKSQGIVVSQDIPLENQFFEYKNQLLNKYREEVKFSEEELKDFFDKNKARYKINAYINSNIALVNIKSSSEDDKLAKEKAEKILKEVTKDNFDQKGKELLKEKGYIYEDLGTFSKGTMVKEFEEAVMETPSDSITKKIVKTGFGYHIIFVKENNSKESKWTASHILVRVEPSQKTIDEKMKKLEKLKEDLEKGVINFAEIEKLDEDIIQNVTIDGITPDGNIPNIGFSKEITDIMFKQGLDEVGIIKNNSMFILFKKVKEEKDQAADFEKSKNRVKNDFINYKALKKMGAIYN